MTIHGNNIYLRPSKQSDAKYFLKWTENIDSIKYSLWDFQIPKDKNDYTEYINSSKFSKGRISLMICDNNSKKPVGEIGLSSIDLINKRARTFTLIGDHTYRNRGIGKEAKSLLLDYAFNTLNLNRIYCSVTVDNKYWIESLKKLGFKLEGIERQASYRDGEYRDKVLLALTKEDWVNRLKITANPQNREHEFFACIKNPKEVFKNANELFILQSIKMNIYTFKHPSEKGISVRVKEEESNGKTAYFMDLKRKVSEERQGTSYVRNSKEYSLRIDSGEIALKIIGELNLEKDKSLTKTRYVFYVDKFLVYLDHYTKPDNSWWIEIENASRNEAKNVLKKLNGRYNENERKPG